jgi:hypothetical protein
MSERDIDYFLDMLKKLSKENREQFVRNAKIEIASNRHDGWSIEHYENIVKAGEMIKEKGLAGV